MEVIKNAQMKEYSNMKVGGIAKELIFVEEKNELKEIINNTYKVETEVDANGLINKIIIERVAGSSTSTKQ